MWSIQLVVQLTSFVIVVRSEAIQLNLIRGQCKARCLEQYGIYQTHLQRDGSEYKELDCSNYTCSRCSSDCEKPVSSLPNCLLDCAYGKLRLLEQHRNETICEDNCRFLYAELDARIATMEQQKQQQPKSDSFEATAELITVSLLCMSYYREADKFPMVFAKFAIKPAGNVEDFSLQPSTVYYTEYRHKMWSPAAANFVESSWFKLGWISSSVFSVNSMHSGARYQLRSMAIHVNGKISPFSETDWITPPDQSTHLEPPLSISYKTQWKQKQHVRALVTWTAYPSYPSCYYHLVWRSSERAESRSFEVDRSMSYVLDSLGYNSTITVLINTISNLSFPREESKATSTQFSTESCLHYNNYSFLVCAPGPVRNLSVSSISNDTSSAIVVIHWLSPDYWSSNSNPLTGYSLKFRSLPHLSLRCSKHVELNRTFPADLEPEQHNFTTPELSSGCAYHATVWAESVAGHGQHTAIVFQWNDDNDVIMNDESNQSSNYVSPLLVPSGLYQSPRNMYYFYYIPAAIAAVAFLSCAIMLVFFVVTKRRKVRPRNPQFPGSFRRQTLDRSLNYSTITNLLASLLPRNPYYIPRPGRATSKKECDDNCCRIATISDAVTPRHFSANRMIDFAKELAYTARLGEGAFGIVHLANCGVPGLPPVVAAKILKNQPTPEAVSCLKEEIERMRTIGYHPNIVCFMGYSERPLGIVLEYCPQGDLKKFLHLVGYKLLRKSGNSVRTLKDSGVGDSFPEAVFSSEAEQNTERLVYAKNLIKSDEECVSTFLRWAQQVSCGMHYLSFEKDMVHRDLAARNVLLTNGAQVAKISDFGLMREGDYQQLNGGHLPVKWLAPECILHQQFTSKSDVWSFGILLYEIVTVGGNPYPGKTMSEVIELLKSGYRMPKPRNCNEDLYHLMKDCWRRIPEQRPTFAQLLEKLEELSSKASKLEYLNLEIVAESDVLP